MSIKGKITFKFLPLIYRHLITQLVPPTRTKDYGILSAVFQLYADCDVHFKIPPTVFYPRPKVDSALVGLKFLRPTRLRRRLGGVDPADLRSVVAKKEEKLSSHEPLRLRDRLAKAEKERDALRVDVDGSNHERNSSVGWWICSSLSWRRSTGPAPMPSAPRPTG